MDKYNGWLKDAELLIVLVNKWLYSLKILVYFHFLVQTRSPYSLRLILFYNYFPEISTLNL